MPLKSMVVFDSSPAFSGLLFAESFGGALAVQKPRPPVIDSVQSGGLGLAGTVGFSAGARSRRDASGQQGQ